MSEKTQLELVISLSVLEDLGINLYGNVPAVLSEMVANAWDADATKVEISYHSDEKKIVIRDNGIGMTRDELQSYYLTVGHKRRVAGRTETPLRNRKPMGRKGIGKLSAFSIAEMVQVETIKDGQKTAIKMDVNAIKKQIEANQKAVSEGKEPQGSYKPEEIEGNWNFRKGTRITLSNLRKKRIHVGKDLRKRLARRFFVLGANDKFDIVVDSKEIKLEDRGYLNLLEYVWSVGLTDSDPVLKKIKQSGAIAQKIELKDGEAPITGWIGTATSSGALTSEEANAIALVVRGKMAAPDLLSRFGVRELASKYMVGEIHANFLDDDDADDIATSDRQGFVEEDDRFRNLTGTVHRVVREVVNGRKRLKEDEAEETATEIFPQIAKWLQSLKPDRRDAARKLLGSINNIYTDDEEAKREHLRQAIVAHQLFDARGRLRELEKLADEHDAKAVLAALGEFDQYEAALYHGVAQIRVEVIRTLRDEFLEKNELENLVRDYLGEHLWLLDPTWDRATEPVETEKTVKKYLDKAAAKLSQKEKDARFDIVYRKGARRHVVVELKRYKRKVSIGDLVDQIQKYSRALKKGLTEVNEPYDAHEIVCLVGPNQDFLEDEDARKVADQTLRPHNGRILTYDEMLKQALEAYKDFLKAEEKRNELVELLASISADDGKST